MGSTADGYPWIDDLDQPADMSAWTLMAADAAQAVLDAHEAAANPHPGYATDADVAGKVSKSGDTMSDDLRISRGTPGIHLDDSPGAGGGCVWFERQGLARWLIQPRGTEGGAGSGSDLHFVSRNDDGGTRATPLIISRATGLGTVAGNPVVPLGIVTKQYADAADAGKVSKAGDTMTGTLIMGGPAGGALDIFGADASTVRLRASGGQVEVVDTAGVAVAPVAHANATYANQSMTLGQKSALQHFAPRPADDDPVAVLCGIVAAGLTAESLEAAGVEMIRDTDGNAVGFHHERLLALLVAAVARTADGAP